MLDRQSLYENIQLSIQGAFERKVYEVKYVSTDLELFIASPFNTLTDAQEFK